MRRVAHRLAQDGVAPDVILTSPLARCATTAAIVRDVLGLPDAPQADPVLAPGFGVAQLQALLASHEDATELMLVGHEPDLSRIVEHLTGAHLVMKKGALVELELSREVPQSAVLVRLEQPEHLVP